VGLLWLVFLINYIDRQIIFSIYPALSRDLKFSNAQLGLIGSVFISIYALSSIPMGRIADLFRRDRLIVASLVLWSGATLGTGLSHSVSVFLFWRGVMGITEALYLPAAAGLIGELHPGSTRSRALSLHGTAQMTGIVIGGWSGGWIADRFGWRYAFILLSVLGLAYAPIIARSLGKIPRTGRKTTNRATPGDLARSNCYLGFALAFSAYCIMLWMVYAWLPDFLYGRFKLSMAESGLRATLYVQISTAIGVVASGALADWAVKRVPPARFYAAGFGILISAPFASMIFHFDSLSWVTIACLGFGLFAGGLHGNVVSAAYDVVPRENYGIAVGALNTIGGLAGGVAVLFAGIWKESVGIPALMGGAATFAAAAAALFLVIVYKNFPRESKVYAPDHIV
jgi:MFS family permease